MPTSPQQKKIGKEKWIWMPHPAHFICASDCKFFLATKVGKYIVSTVGEYFPDYRVRKIFADSRGKNIEGIGDEYDRNYMKEIGFEDIRYERKYETMVFEAEKMPEGGCKACPYHILVSREVDFRGYNDPKEAYEGHMELCNKWSKTPLTPKKK